VKNVRKPKRNAADHEKPISLSKHVPNLILSLTRIKYQRSNGMNMKSHYVINSIELKVKFNLFGVRTEIYHCNESLKSLSSNFQLSDD